MRKTKFTTHPTFNAILLAVFAMILGCEKPPEIATHKIPKDQSGLAALREKQRPAPPQPPTVETRMVVAIFENTDATWFFKVNGPKAVVDATQSKWQPVIESVEFIDGEPKWKAQDWEALGPKPFRHATLIVPESDPPLELAISSLGPNQDLLLNVNRWLGQLGLPKASNDELSDLLKDKKSETATYIQFEAVGKGAGKMQPPFAGGAPFANAPFANAPFANAPSAGSPPPSKVEYQTPEGWTAGKTSFIVHARLSKESEQGKIQLTIVDMPADVNDWKPNVERWLGQIGMKLDDAQIESRSKTITIDGTEGNVVDPRERLRTRCWNDRRNGKTGWIGLVYQTKW